LSKGSYVMRVSRDKAAIDNKDYVYSLTVRNAGTPITNDSADLASREFLTTERPSAGIDVSSSVASVLGLFSTVNMIA
ncbi:MAG: hypothetical protein ABI647_05580, partial [Gemmatimonadota bacterium]